MLIGSHVSFSKEQLLGSVKEAISYGANCFMFYTGAPQNTLRKEINKDLLFDAKKLMEENNINIKNVICHAPYIINLANNKEEKKWLFSIEFLKKELSRCEMLGISYMVLHPGSSVGQSKEVALNNIVNALNLIYKESFQCQILLETMALKGSEIGSLEDIKYIMEQVNENLGICLDTCHMSDAGYDMSFFDELLNLIDQMIGLEKLHCIHLNDSKNEVGAHKDRHANIGYGKIGFNNLSYICYHPKLKKVPKILETPYIGNTWEDKERKYPPYRFEIQMLKENKFDENLLSQILEYYNK